MATSFFPNDLITGKPCSVVEMCEYTGLRAVHKMRLIETVNLTSTRDLPMKNRKGVLHGIFTKFGKGAYSAPSRGKLPKERGGGMKYMYL